MAASLNPTTETYKHLKNAYTHMNKLLFANALPPCLITLQRENGALGYYYPKRFVSDSNATISTDEIALNPQYFRQEGRKDREIIATLVHEMCHLWQHHFGKPGRGRYHNKEWGKKMKSVGLYPSNTGMQAGAETGDQMSHYIITDGVFVKAYDKLVKKGFALEWMEYPDHILQLVKSGALPASKVAEFITDGEDYEALDIDLVEKAWDMQFDEDEKPAPKPKKVDTSKVKQTCPSCNLNAWAKLGSSLICGDCSITMIPGNGRLTDQFPFSI